MKKLIKLIRDNREDIKGCLKFILYFTMLVLIFKFSKEFSYYLQNMELEDLEKAIEIILTLSFTVAIFSNKKK